MLSEHWEARPTIELALDRFETVDLLFDDALTVPILKRPGNCREVPTYALDEANQIRQARFLSPLQPALQRRPVAVACHLHKACQVLLQSELIWRALVALLQEHSLLSGEVCRIFATPPAETASA